MLNYHGVWATRIGQSITCITLPYGQRAVSLEPHQYLTNSHTLKLATPGGLEGPMEATLRYDAIALRALSLSLTALSIQPCRTRCPWSSVTAFTSRWLVMW